MTKTRGISIVFVRHGHRDKPIPDANNGLSAKGFRQVDDLVKAYKSEKLPSAKIFWTSPKLRCQETLAPLSKLAEMPLKIEKLLDEQGPAESRKDFTQRLEALISKAVSLNETVYLCSHGDVIPEAIDLLTGKQVDASKGEAIQISRDKRGRWEIL